MIRFHLDENMPVWIATGLRKRDIDITTSNDASLISASDEEQLAYALKEECVIITRDSDFLRLHAKGINHFGIIYWTQRQNSAGRLIQVLDLFSLSKSNDEVKGQVEFL